MIELIVVAIAIPHFAVIAERVAKENSADLTRDFARIDIHLPDSAVDILLVVVQKAIQIAQMRDVVLLFQPIQRRHDALAERHFINVQAVDHQHCQVFKIAGHILSILEQEEQLEHVEVFDLQTVMVFRRALGAFDHAADSAFQKGHDAVIETAEGYEYTFLLIHNTHRGLLKRGKHRTRAAGEVLARRAMLTDFHQDLLKQLILVWHKGIAVDERFLRLVALQVATRTLRERKEIAHCGGVLLIEQAEQLLGVIVFLQKSAVDDLVHRRRREAQPGVETALDF